MESEVMAKEGGKAQIVLVLMFVITLMAIPLILAGNAALIMEFECCSNCSAVLVGLWTMDGSAFGNKTAYKSQDTNHSQGVFHGSIYDQIKHFEGMEGFKSPRLTLNFCAACNLCAGLFAFAELVLQVIILGKIFSQVSHRYNRILLVASSSIVLFFTLDTCMLLFILVYEDMQTFRLLSSHRTQLDKEDFYFTWFLFMLSDGGKNPSVIGSGASLDLSLAFITVWVGLALVIVVFVLSFIFSVAAKSDTANRRLSEKRARPKSSGKSN